MNAGKMIITNERMDRVLTVDRRTGAYEVDTTLGEAVSVLLDINERQTTQLEAVGNIIELLENELGVRPADGMHANIEGDLAHRLNRCMVRLALNGVAQ